MGARNFELRRAVARGDKPEVVRIAQVNTAKTLRYLIGRLYAEDRNERRKTVGALGAVTAERIVLSDQKLRELLRRFFWWLNNESGAVPFGVPEAIGEMLAVRPEFQAEFLPILCSMVVEEEMAQTGDIERGVLWAVGRVGVQVANCSPEAVAAVDRAARNHPDQETRRVAQWALSRFSEAQPDP